MNHMDLNERMAFMEAMMGINAMRGAGTALLGLGDPARSGSYQLGKSIVIPGTSNPQYQQNPFQVIKYQRGDKVCRWKIVLGVSDPNGLFRAAHPQPYGAGLDFTIQAAMESETLTSTVRVGLGNSEVLYRYGRSIDIKAINPFDLDLTCEYELDEFQPGISVWRTFQVVPTAGGGVEANLTIPNFARSLVLFSPNGGPVITLYAYVKLPSGVTLVYSEAFAVSRTVEIPLIPGADYTISTPGGASAAVVMYGCVG